MLPIPQYAASLLLFAVLGLTGCGVFHTPITSTDSPGSSSLGAIHGMAYGGNQPVINAHVYLYAASTSGYGSASTSLLGNITSGTFPTTPDTFGKYYVTTDSSGTFNISGEYTCTQGTQIYIYVTLGNPGAGVNSAVGLMAILGQCPASGSLAATIPFVMVNEVTTVAAAYAMAGFAADVTHVGSSGTSLAQVGIANAFLNAANLASLTTGTALATTPAGNGTVSQSLINTIANILAACVNSNGPTSSACSTLFADATSQGQVATLSSPAPTETASAAIFIAQNPAANVAGLFNLSLSSPPFVPTLSTVPNDFTVAIVYSGFKYATGIAIDTAGNAWVTNEGNSGNTEESVAELSSTGAPVLGSPYTPTGMNHPFAVAVDSSSDAWVLNLYGGTIFKLAANGSAFAGSPFAVGSLTNSLGVAIDGTGYVWLTNSTDNTVAKLTGAGTAVPGSPFSTGAAPFNGQARDQAIAIDGAGSAWITNYGPSISKLAGNGAAITGSAGYTGAGLNYPDAIAIDGSGNAWVANSQGQSVSEFSNTGNPLSTSQGFTGGGLNTPSAIAIDGSGNVLVANSGYSYSYQGGVTKLSKSGTALSGANGFLSSCVQFCFQSPQAIAVDGSGNVWVANYGGSVVLAEADTVTELIGAATPVITPIVAGLPTTPTSDGSSNLGTRP